MSHRPDLIEVDGPSLALSQNQDNQLGNWPTRLETARDLSVR